MLIKIMKEIAYIFVATILLSSCATILKTKNYELKVLSDKSDAKLQTSDSVYALPATINVTRSKADLHLTLISDSSRLDYIVKPSPNPTFLYWNLIGFYMSPAFYAVDFTNSKRFYYGKNVFLNSNDTVRILKPPTKVFWEDFFSEKHFGRRQELNLSISIPYLNGFSFRPADFGTKVNLGFWGISTGIAYSYRSNRYVKMKLATASDFYVPFPMAVTPDDVRESLTTAYLELTNNRRFGKLDFGIGMNYCRNNWRFIDEIDPKATVITNRRHQSIGFTGQSHLQVLEVFFIGLIYRPTFFEVYPSSGYKYEHLISLDFEFRIPLNEK